MIPIINSNYKLFDFIKILFLLIKKNCVKNSLPNQTIREEIAHKFIDYKNIFFFDSATTGIHLILNFIKRNNINNEVIIPGYTASKLIKPIINNGLVPVICDISLKTFCLDTEKLKKKITNKTLAIITVNSFGILCDIDSVYNLISSSKNKITIIEDWAQSFGSYYKKRVYSPEFIVISFARGKNLSIGSGGALLTNNQQAEDFIKNFEFEKTSLKENIYKIFKNFIINILLNEQIYGMLFSILSKLKKAENHDYKLKEISEYDTIALKIMLDRIDYEFQKRKENFNILYEYLINKQDLILPEISKNTDNVYLRFPVLIKDESLKNEIINELISTGIEGNILYDETIAEVLEILTDDENSKYFSKHLITLPIHSNMKNINLQNIKNVFDKYLK